MATAKRPGGLYYIGDKAVDAEGREIKDAPKRKPDTDPSQQPGAPGSATPAQSFAQELAAALRGTSSVVGTATTTADADGGEEELPTLGELEDHISSMSADEVKALQARDERKGSVSIYEARLAELEGK